jgi:hypothetical protein
VPWCITRKYCLCAVVYNKKVLSVCRGVIHSDYHKWTRDLDRPSNEAMITNVSFRDSPDNFQDIKVTSSSINVYVWIIHEPIPGYIVTKMSVGLLCSLWERLRWNDRWRWRLRVPNALTSYLLVHVDVSEELNALLSYNTTSLVSTVITSRSAHHRIEILI